MILPKVADVAIQVGLLATGEWRGAGFHRHHLLEASDELKTGLVRVVVIDDHGMLRYAREGVEVRPEHATHRTGIEVAERLPGRLLIAHHQRLELQHIEFALDDEQEAIERLLVRGDIRRKQLSPKHAGAPWLEAHKFFGVGLAQPQGHEPMVGIRVEKDQPCRLMGQALVQPLLRLLQGGEALCRRLVLFRRAPPLLAFEPGDVGLRVSQHGLEVCPDIEASRHDAQQGIVDDLRMDAALFCEIPVGVLRTGRAAGEIEQCVMTRFVHTVQDAWKTGVRVLMIAGCGEGIATLGRKTFPQLVSMLDAEIVPMALGAFAFGAWAEADTVVLEQDLADGPH